MVLNSPGQRERGSEADSAWEDEDFSLSSLIGGDHKTPRCRCQLSKQLAVGVHLHSLGLVGGNKNWKELCSVCAGSLQNCFLTVVITPEVRTRRGRTFFETLLAQWWVSALCYVYDPFIFNSRHCSGCLIPNNLFPLRTTCETSTTDQLIDGEMEAQRG